MSSRIIPFEYEGHPVRFNAEGWINATEIAEREGRRLDVWLKTQDTEAYIEALGRHLNTTERWDLIMTRRGRNGGTWLHPKLAVAFARWLSPDFAAWCDLKIDALLRGDGKPWASARREAAIGYRGMCDALAFHHEARGKTPKRHHFINEARLVNEVITGAFAGRDRDQLSAAELELVTLVELRDTALMGTDMTYAERKANLSQYMQGLQGKRLAGGKAA